VFQIFLTSDNKICFYLMDLIEHHEVVVCSVKDVVGVWFIRDFFHCFRIVDSGFGDVEESWDLGLQIIQCMDFYTSFSLAKLCPPEYGKTYVYRCGIKRVDVTSKVENPGHTFFSRWGNQIVSIL